MTTQGAEARGEKHKVWSDQRGLSRRVGLMDDILKMGAVGRKMCWNKDIPVFSFNDACVEWVRTLPSWEESEGPVYDWT